MLRRLLCRTIREHLLACLVTCAQFASPALAIAPPHVTDEELAISPVIVVGRWNKTPITVHSGTIYDWTSK
jgi:hypothetical protein